MRRGWVRASAIAATALAWGVPGSGASAAAAPELRFVRGAGGAPDERIVRSVTLAGLLDACGSRVIRVDDPYYGRPKRFHAVALRCALRLGFGGLPDADQNLFLRARDGYARPASGARLTEPGGWLAFADADRSEGDPRSPGFRPAWEPIDRRHLDPSPFYLVWSGPDQRDPHRDPWPYQLVEIELAPLERLLPHTVPRDSPPGSPARRGFAIFRDECIACHAVNGEGGTVGPDLNVPRSIVEYRPEEQIKAYVRDPQSFRYTTMPAHPDLDDADLDALVAYFRAMSRLKHDPKRAAQ